MNINHIDGINGFHGQEARPPVSVFTGYQFGHLAFSTTTTFPWFLASNQSIVELDDIREAIERIPIPIAVRNTRNTR